MPTLTPQEIPSFVTAKLSLKERESMARLCDTCELSPEEVMHLALRNLLNSFDTNGELLEIVGDLKDARPLGERIGCVSQRIVNEVVTLSRYALQLNSATPTERTVLEMIINDYPAKEWRPASELADYAEIYRQTLRT